MYVILHSSLLFLTITSTTSKVDIDLCKSKCYCGFGNVDCTEKGIQKIPLVPGNTINLDLPNNNISSLNSIFQASIINLDLTNNNIESIEKNELEKFPGLSSLNLDGNKIEEFDSDVLRDMLHINFVMIRRNGVKEATFGELPPNIKIIRLEQNLLRSVEFQPSFDRNGSVQIYLEWNPIHCGCAFLKFLHSLGNVQIFGQCYTPEPMKGHLFSVIRARSKVFCTNDDRYDGDSSNAKINVTSENSLDTNNIATTFKGTIRCVIFALVASLNKFGLHLI